MSRGERLLGIVVAALRGLAGLELPVLLAVGLLSAGLWAFAELADEVLEGETRSLDERILLLARDAGDPDDPVGPAWFEEMMRDFTALGGFGLLTFVTLAATAFLLLQRRRRDALMVFAAVASGILASTALKLAFARPRPDLVTHGSIVYTASFPSGHSMLAAVTYLTLGALLARMLARRRERVFVLGVALIATLLVGISRVYLGVHWPTDVLAGWTAGAAWAAAWWLASMGWTRAARPRRAAFGRGVYRAGRAGERTGAGHEPVTRRAPVKR